MPRRPAVLPTLFSALVPALLAAGLVAPPQTASAQASAPALPRPAAAQDAAPAMRSRLDDIVARGVLRVGTTGDYKPFTLRLPASDKYVGLDIALAEDLARTLGVRLEIVPTAWGRLLPDLLADRYDLAMGGISVTLDRQRQAFFSIPVNRDGKTPIARCADVQKYQTLEQIDKPEVRVIVNPGGTNEKFDRAHLAHAKIVVWPDNVTIFDRLAAGDADLMITDGVETKLQERLHPHQLCAVHPDAPFDFSEKAVLMPRDTVLKDYVDQWLHQLVESGTFAKMNDEWLAYPWPQAAAK